MSTATATDLFIWDRNYDNIEQVRPYLDDFLTIAEGITGTRYNDLFKGKIPGLIGSPNEDTGIYLLQTLADLDALKERTQQFLADGGYRLTDRMPKPNVRGTLIHTGFYMGDTGWAKHEHVKVMVNEDGYVLFKLPRQRNWRTSYAGPSGYLFKEDQS